MRVFLLTLWVCLSLAAAERAAYDSNGRIIALITNAEDVEVSTSVVAVLPNGKRVPIQVRRDGRGAERQGEAAAWTLNFQLADGGRGRMELKSDEDTTGVRYSAAITAESPLEVDAIEFVIDVPRAAFLNGRVAPDGSPAVALDGTRGLTPVLYRADTTRLSFSGSTATFAVAFDQPRSVAVVDRWDNLGRSYQVRATVRRGMWATGDTATITSMIEAAAVPPAVPLEPARIALDAAKVRYSFDGFGGNYCWNNSSPVADFTMKNLKLAWGRAEMKIQDWDRQRDTPGPALKADFERMREFQRLGVKWVISIWWLPERFYTDSYEKPRSAHMRTIDGRRWDELLDLLGSYLLYAKREYGTEPDLFSFNEANIGIYVGLTPESHTEAIRRIGAHFEKLGLKTKMLLGDATGPRDTHRFVLDAAADPEAMKYIGAVGFHSWGGGTPEQYAAWGDVAEWLKLPLLVTELGVDAAAYYTRSWDSYHYGLREARMTQELLIHARPQGTQYWQFTNDYALARVKDGVVQPLARFWLMKHFTDLTPHGSEALAVTSNQKAILVTAFRKGDAYVVHLLNMGAARKATFEGLPDAGWRITETTEEAQFVERAAGRSSAGVAFTVEVPARALVTLVGTGGGVPRARAQSAQPGLSAK